MTTPQTNDLSFSETRARKLHDNAVVVMAHDHGAQPEDYKDMRAGGVTIKILKLTADGLVWIKESDLVPDNQAWPAHANPAPTALYSKRHFINDYTGWSRWFEQSLDQAVLVAEACGVRVIRTVADIEAAKRDKASGVILGSEGARHLERTIARVEQFYRRGVRELQLYWPMGNQLFKDGHLSNFGREVIRECNRLGILLDVSHIVQVSEVALLETLEASADPVIVSHDAPQALGGGELSDDLIRAVARSGGGHGIFALHTITPDYIVNQTDKSKPATLPDMVAAIDYVVRLIGIEHIAIGGDITHEPGFQATLDIPEMPALTLALMRSGYTDNQILKILGTNMIDLCRRVWGD